MRLLHSRPPDVEKLKRKGDVDGLVRALRYEDPVTDRDGRFVDLGAYVRDAAVAALAELDSLPLEPLLQALEDPEEGVRIAAVRALGARQEPASGEALFGAVLNWTGAEYARARREAVDALATLRFPGLGPYMVSEMLGRSAGPDHADGVALRRLAQAEGPDEVEATLHTLVAHLRDGSSPDRVRALLVALAPESVEALVGALDDPVTRREAALALGEIQDGRAIERLCSLVAEADDPATRSAAAWALGEIRDTAAVGALLGATNDSDYSVRADALAGFDKLGNAGIAVAMSVLRQPEFENGGMPRPGLATATPPPPPPPPGAAPALRRLLGRYLNS